MKKITLLIFCLLNVWAVYAVKITVNGITYDDHGSTTIHDGLYRNVTVVAVSDNFTGDLVIPAIPAEFSGGLFYFRVTRIATNVFRDNEKITSVTIPNTVNSLEGMTFARCTNLTSATLACKTIDNYAFHGCTNLSSASFTKEVTEIGVFYGCPNFSHFDVAPENELYASSDGVLYNKNHTALISYPVAKKDALFTIPGTVTVIAESAFESTSLVSVVIPSSITTIGDWTFGNCLSLTSVTISQGVTSISPSAFNACTALKSFEVAPGNTAYSSSDGILYNKNKTTIHRFPPNKTGASFTIPAGVTKIGRYTFRDCLNLSSVVVPGNVTSIESGAFAWSTIKSVKLSNKVNFIDLYAFSGCQDLTDLTVFWNNPSEVTTPTPEWPDEDLFAGVDKSSVKLHVPPGTKAVYQASDIWGDFNIVDDANVTGIADTTTGEGVAIYPNPASSYLVVSGLKGDEKLEIYTITGQTLFSVQAANEAETISVGHLPAGIYLLKIENGKVLKWTKR